MTAERLLLVGGLVVDGTGHKPPERADVLLSDGRGEAFLRPASYPADGPVGLESARSLDCTGALVTPGFIDIHTHSDLTWLTTPDCSSRVTQAITTEVVGNCGMSPAPRSRHDPSFRQTISVIDQDPGTPLGFESFDEYLGHLT